MPTYDYHCEECGRTQEIFHSINETRRKCPHCGSTKFRRLFGPGAGFLFRGSGFYITDYRSPEYLSKAKAESGGGSGAAESKPSSSDSPSRPAEKTEKTEKPGKVEKTSKRSSSTKASA